MPRKVSAKSTKKSQIGSSQRGRNRGDYVEDRKKAEQRRDKRTTEKLDQWEDDSWTEVIESDTIMKFLCISKGKHEKNITKPRFERLHNELPLLANFFLFFIYLISYLHN